MAFGLLVFLESFGKLVKIRIFRFFLIFKGIWNLYCISCFEDFDVY